MLLALTAFSKVCITMETKRRTLLIHDISLCIVVTLLTAQLGVDNVTLSHS